jgi:hypothetical protein
MAFRPFCHFKSMITAPPCLLHTQIFTLVVTLCRKQQNRTAFCLLTDMILNPFCLCLWSLLPALIFAQSQFLNPDSNVQDGTQSFSSGSNLEIKWKAGWWGLGTKQPYADLFITDFKSESFVKLLRSEYFLQNCLFELYGTNQKQRMYPCRKMHPIHGRLTFQTATSNHTGCLFCVL